MNLASTLDLIGPDYDPTKGRTVRGARQRTLCAPELHSASTTDITLKQQLTEKNKHITTLALKKQKQLNLEEKCKKGLSQYQNKCRLEEERRSHLLMEQAKLRDALYQTELKISRKKTLKCSRKSSKKLSDSEMYAKRQWKTSYGEELGQHKKKHYLNPNNAKYKKTDLCTKYSDAISRNRHSIPTRSHK